jgi:hypothetical protein
MIQPHSRATRARVPHISHVVACVVACLALIPVSALAKDATIGLYTDSNGYSCSFSGNNPGPVTAYVVVYPGSNGIRGVRFAAPIPSCFDATFISESTPDIIAAIGSSQTGISLSSRYCETDPFYVMEITYMNNGGTQSCCAFPIVADPFTGWLEAVDCAYNQTPINPVTSHFNANASCECGSNYPPPLAASNPAPPNNATSVGLDPILQWESSDPSGLALFFDVYFGTDTNPPLAASNIPVTGPISYVPGHLADNAIYYWHIVMRNASGAESNGVLWRFTTRSNLPPEVSYIAPAYGAITSATPTLMWLGTDHEGGVVTYDVYLGTDPSPPLKASHVTATSYTPARLLFSTQYFWRIVARDPDGQETSGPVWMFITKANFPPEVSYIAPAYGAITSATPTLSWSGHDPESGVLTYDVYLGTDPSPPLKASHLTTPSYTPARLSFATQYWWRIVVKDSDGQEASGPTWMFATGADPPPTVITVSPACEATAISVTPTLAWSAQESYGQSMTYDVYLGTTPSMALVASGLTSTSYSSPALSFLTTYYWSVLAHDSGGQSGSSALCTFTTKAVNEPPFAPNSPSPADNAVDQPALLNLSWQCSDPEGQALKYDIYLGKGAPPPVGAEIGLYTDEYGSTCSFSGNQAGILNAYVVVKPHGSGIRGVRFSAPIPDCFGATFVAESTPGLLVAIGSSQTGISISSPSCEADPFYALQIVYMTSGGTTPCCEFPILADPITGLLEAVDCAYANTPINSVTSHFNADTSCPCGQPPLPLIASNTTNKIYSPQNLQLATIYQWKIVARDTGGLETSGPVWAFTTKANQAPAAPSSPSPANGAINAPNNTTLSWTCSDPEGQALKYDVYFGTTVVPPLAATNIAPRFFNPGLEAWNTTYYWRISARDTYGAVTSGPTWSFTIKPENLPPAAPTPVSPGNGGTGLPVNTTLAWTCSDPESQALKYDVYLGTAASPPLVASNVTSPAYDPGLLQVSTTYKWRIVACDTYGAETSSATWSFKTSSDANLAPHQAGNPAPRDGDYISNTSPVLAWYTYDPEHDPLTFYIYGGPADNPYQFAGQTSVFQFSPGPLQPGMWYYWHVDVTDGHFYVGGATWSFYLSGGGIPVLFSKFDASARRDAVEIRWELSSDEPMESYALYRRDGTAGTPRVVTEGPVAGARDSYLDKTVEPGKTYGYEIIIHAANGDDFRSSIATVTMPSLELTLYQNQPNPFNPQTTIRYDLPGNAVPMRVRLSIVDLAGHRVRTLIDEDQAAGSRSAVWNGRDDNGSQVASGVYFYVLDVGKQRLTKKLVLLK